MRWALLAAACACGSTTSGPSSPKSMTAPNDAYLAACRADLAEARKDLDAIRSAPSHTAETVLGPYDRVLTVLDRWASRSGLYTEVHPDAKMREAAETCVKESSAL